MTKKKSELLDPTSFFDTYGAEYGYIGPDTRPYGWDLDCIEFMKKNLLNCTLLDVGAGRGSFARLVRQRIREMHVTALDPSIRLLNTIEDPSIRKVVGKLPALNLNRDEKFSFVHLAYVLHHLVGNTIRESCNAVNESLFILKNCLDDSGFLMIEEEYWETYLVPSASRTLAFYLLSAMNALNVAVPPFLSHFCSQSVKGLRVCMYTRSELRNITRGCGFEIVRYEIQPYPLETARQKRFRRLAVLKGWGRVLLIVKKVPNSELTK